MDLHPKNFSANVKDFYKFELSDVIQTACLAHDIGNPPFGHFGEEAIRTFFDDFFKNNSVDITENQKQDLCKFEGNANAFRILTSLFLESGLKLTYTSLASIIKYPSDSISGFNKKSGFIATKKSGYFNAEENHFLEVVKELEIPQIAPNIYARHPYVFLVEAADDICYRIIDLEDAHSLNVISIEEAIGLLLPLFDGDSAENYVKDKLEKILDNNQKLTFLRAMLINVLVKKCTDVFIKNEEALLNGTLNKSLIELIDEHSIGLLKKIDAFSFKKIYNHKAVIEKELAGYHVISGLLHEFVSAYMNFEHSKSQKVLNLIPAPFVISQSQSMYQNLLAIVDFVSSMTDVFALDLYRKMKGIQSPDFG